MGEYAGKSSVFSTRIRPDLRRYLEKAAKTSGRSLSQEVEHRLRRSFVEDDKIADAFGDRRTYRLMRMMADAIHLSQELDMTEPRRRALPQEQDVAEPRGRAPRTGARRADPPNKPRQPDPVGDNWLDDPFRFRVALAAMRSVVVAIEPRSSLPDDGESMIIPNTLGAVIAGKLWEAVNQAKDSIELRSGSLADHINSIARSDIGENVFGRALEGIKHVLFYASLDPAEPNLADQDYYDETEGRDE